MLQILNPFKAGQKFRELKSEEKWTVALAIVFIAGLLSVVADVLVFHKSLDLRIQYAAGRGCISIKEEMQWVVTAFRIVFSIIFIPVAWGLKSVVFHVFSRNVDGEGDEVSSTMHVIAYTYLPFIFKGFLDVYKGLTYQTPSYKEFAYQLQNPHLFLIKEYNIFFLWAFILMVIAIRERYNISNKRAFLVVLIPYVVYWIIIAITSFGEF